MCRLIFFKSTMQIRKKLPTNALLLCALLLKAGFAFSVSTPLPADLFAPELQQMKAQPVGGIDAAKDAAQLKQALSAAQSGKLEEAMQIARKSVAANPASASSHEVLGVVLGLKGDLANSRLEFEKAISLEPGQWTAMVKLGDIDYAERQLKQAEANYRKAEALKPTDGQLAQRLGLIEEARGNLDAAANYFENGVAVLDNDAVSIRPNLAAIYNLRGQYQKAIDLFKSVPLDKVKSTPAYMVVAEAKFGLNKQAEALALLEKARSATPKNPAPWILTGRIARSAGENPLALKAFTEALRLRPEASGIELELALTEIANGKPEAGIKRAEEVAKRLPNDPLASLGLAQAYAESGNKAQAIERYRALLTNPSVARKATIGLADALENDNRFSESETLLVDYIKKYPQDVEAIQHLGSVQATQRKYKAAIASFDSALVLSPENPNLLRLSAVSYAKLGNYKQAIVLSEKLTKISPSSSSAWLLLATFSEEAGELTSAERYYRTVLARAPNNVIAQNNLAILLLTRGEKREANKFADSLKVSSPNNAEIMDTVGWVYFQTGRKSEALPILERIQADKRSAGTWYHLAVVLADKGERQKAAEAASKALSLNPDFKYAREAKALAEAAK